MSEKIYYMDTPKEMMRVPESKLEEFKVLMQKWEKEEQEKKQQAFKEWIESKNVDGVLKTTEAEITNVVSRIGARRKKMPLTEVQQILKDALYLCPLTERTRVIVFLMMETEEQALKMARFIVDNEQVTEEEVIAEARKIAEG